MNLQVIASPDGDILWVSGALPGWVHDKKAEWIWGVLEAAGLVTLADKGYQGSMHAKIPDKGKNKPQSQNDANKAHARLRSPGERANAQLKTWCILLCYPWRAGQLAKAIPHCRSARQTQDEKVPWTPAAKTLTAGHGLVSHSWISDGSGFWSGEALKRVQS